MRTYLSTFLCCIGLLSGFTSCSDDDDETTATTNESPTTSSISRTVLVYQAADNSLGTTYLQSDSVEMAAGAKYMESDERLLCFIDDGDLPRLIRFHNDGATSVEYQWEEEQNSCDAKFMQSVVEMAFEAYPAESYGIVFWGHGEGWIPAPNSSVSSRTFSIDVGEDGNLSSNTTASGLLGYMMEIDDMANALEASGYYMEYLFFDACLMGDIESAYSLRNTTHYIIASPSFINVYGAYYTNMVPAFFSDDPTDIAKQYYTDTNDESLIRRYGYDGIVIAALCTDSLDALAARLAEALPSSALADGASPDMGDTDHYIGYSSTYGYQHHCYDMRESLKLILQEDDFDDIDALLSCIFPYYAATDQFYIGPGTVYANIDSDNFIGYSMFVPQTIYATNATRCSYGNLNTRFQDTRWYQAAGFAAAGW